MLRAKTKLKILTIHCAILEPKSCQEVRKLSPLLRAPVRMTMTAEESEQKQRDYEASRVAWRAAHPFREK